MKQKAKKNPKSRRRRARSSGAVRAKKGGARARKRKFTSRNVGGIIVRTSGRREKFDADRMAKTVGRSGVPYLMARDIAKKVSRKLLARKASTTGRKTRSPRRVSARTVRKLVANELRQRNRPDIAASYAGEMPANVHAGRDDLENSTEPVLDLTAANRSKLLFDGASRSAKSTKAAR